MLLIWQGLGIAAAVIPFGVLIVLVLVFDAIVGPANATRWSLLMSGIALLIGAELVRRLALRLDRRPGRVMIDKETGEEVTLREAHTLFFVPLRWWVSLEAGLGILLVVLGALDAIGR